MPAYLGKRAFDVAASMTACAVFMPLAATIAFAIWLEDGGPPLSVFRSDGIALSPRILRDGRCAASSG